MKDILDLGIEFKDIFDEKKVYTEIDKARILINDVLEIPIGIFSRRPKKHYKKARLYQTIFNTQPQFYVCITKRCKDIKECWNMEKGILKMPNKYKPNLCAFLKPKKKTFRNPKVSKLSKLSDFEKSLIIVLLENLEIKERETQIKELINKLKYSDLISLS
jgi:hypothetical protein